LLRVAAILALFSFLCHSSLAQQPAFDFKQLSNLKSKSFVLNSDTLELDSLSLFPNSITIRNLANNTLLSSELYRYDAAKNRLIFLPDKRPDSITLSYRSTPLNFYTSYQHKSFNRIRHTDSTLQQYYYFYQPQQVEKNAFIDFGGLNYSGNFARGIQFGSNQDLTLNSNLDLRLSGKISNNIEITAALSDNNIPLQPDGTTQQIQDFDKVYIQLKKDPHIITAGDFTVKNREGYFMRFVKQMQGLWYENKFVFKNKLKLQTSSAIAVSKGKFGRNIFQGAEGNQGPYRLIGNNNETFIIVLAGSEKVYIDGKLLQRGELNDYIMDYNSGELVFMPRYLITKDSRIVVEFEYTDRNYLRTNVNEAIRVEYKNLTAYTQLYLEQDAKNKPILNDLDDSAKAILAGIGNNIQSAYISGVRTADFDNAKVQYALIDTTVNGNYFDSVFQYTNDNLTQVYDLSFSYVGVNKGNYIPTKNANNIRVYQWVAPQNGIPQGSFEPIILIVTPKSQILLTSGVEYKINEKMKLYGEFAFSNNDKNLFSKIDNKQNNGYALLAGASRTDTFKNKKTWVNAVSYEMREKRFQQIEPYRNAEFQRDWNIGNTTQVTEHLPKFNSVFSDDKHGIKSSYNFSALVRTKIYKGFEHTFNFSEQYKNLSISTELRILHSRDTLNKTGFFRPNIQLTYVLPSKKGIGFTTRYFSENNIFKNKETNALQSNSFKNQNIQFVLFMPDTAKWTFTLQYLYRKDIKVKDFAFADSTQAHTIEFKGSANQLKNQTFNWTLTYRHLKPKDSTIQTKAEQTFLGRTEYGFRLFKSALRMNLIYELGGGLEKVRQYTYVQITNGQGFFKWIDENHNGIKELNEFVPSQFADSAQYIRVLTDLNEYVSANSTAYTQTLTIQPKAVWFDKKGIKGFFSRFTLQSYLNVKRKAYKGKLGKSFNPFVFKTADSNTISLSSNIRNTLIFNSGSPTYSISYTNLLVNDKILLLNGFDSRNRMDNIIEAYYNLNTSFTLNLKFDQSRNRFSSQYFTQNNFDVLGFYTEPKLTYQWKTNIRTSLSYSFLHKKNKPDLGAEKALSNNLNWEFRYSKSAKFTAETKFTFAYMKYNGENGTTKSYTILEGLQPGKNYIWNVNYTHNITSNLELTLGYEGRKTGTAKVVNTGRAQLRAVF